MKDRGTTYTLPPVPKLEIPESIYAPVASAVTRWRALQDELAAKREALPALARALDVLAAREYDEERPLGKERTEVRQRIEETKDAIDVLERIKIPKALLAVWATAGVATDKEHSFTRPYDEAWRAFEAACQAILDEVSKLRRAARPTVSMGREFFEDLIELPTGRVGVSQRVQRASLRGVPQPPAPAPEPQVRPQPNPFLPGYTLHPELSHPAPVPAERAPLPTYTIHPRAPDGR